MTRSELIAARRELGMNRVEMAKRLRTPYRAYDKWERGERRIPGACETAIELLLKQDRLLMQSIRDKRLGEERQAVAAERLVERNPLRERPAGGTSFGEVLSSPLLTTV